MKKIVFVLPHMLCGGVEKALLALINELPKDEFEIHILLAEIKGEFVSQIPSEIRVDKIKCPDDAYVVEGTRAALKKFLFEKKYNKFITVCRNILEKKEIASLTVDFDDLPVSDEYYDIAVCFHIHMPLLMRYVLEKIEAKKKIAWIHNDFVSSHFPIDKYKKYLVRYDHIFAVSKELREETIAIVPEIKEKLSVAHNIISKRYIETMLTTSQENVYDDSDSIKILTIGRLESQKGIDIAIDVCKELNSRGHKIDWYVLGEGSQRVLLENKIKKEKLNNIFHLLGIRINPYPYIDQVDIYVQPSRHEGYGIAVAEARVLNKPIVCTDFTGAKEQIVNGKTGFISYSTDELIKNIEQLIIDDALRLELSKNLGETSQCTDSTITEIMGFFK